MVSRIRTRAPKSKNIFSNFNNRRLSKRSEYELPLSSQTALYLQGPTEPTKKEKKDAEAARQAELAQLFKVVVDKKQTAQPGTYYYCAGIVFSPL